MELGVPRDTEIAVGTLRCQVGLRTIDVYPLVSIKVPAMAHLVMPEYVKLEWRKRENKAKPGKVWLHAASADDPNMLVASKKAPKMYETFNRLHKMWTYWFIQLVYPDGSSTEYQVCDPEGKVFKLKTPFSDLLRQLATLTARDMARGIKDSLINVWKKRGLLGTNRRYTKINAKRKSLELVDNLEKMGGPLPWKATKEEEKLLRHDAVVDNYLKVIRSLWFQSYGTGVEVDEAAKEVWELLREAKLFELDERMYLDLHHMADVFTTEVVAEQTWVSSDDPPLEEFDALHYATSIQETGKLVPYPDKMPFDVCLICWGRGPELSYTDKELRKLLQCDSARVVSHLVTTNKAYEILWTTEDGSPGVHIFPIYRDGEWCVPYTLLPWIVMSYMDYLNDHKTVITARKDLSLQMGIGRLRKKKIAAPVPPPYYTVPMRSVVIKRVAGRAMRRSFDVEYSHRWDVVAHDVVKVKRGRLPIDPKEEQDLRDRGYKIYTINLDSEAYRILMMKGMPPKKNNEWVATFVFRRKAHVKGPKDKPYVPSTHKPTDRY